MTGTAVERNWVERNWEEGIEVWMNSPFSPSEKHEVEFMQVSRIHLLHFFCRFHWKKMTAFTCFSLSSQILVSFGTIAFTCHCPDPLDHRKLGHLRFVDFLFPDSGRSITRIICNLIETDQKDHNGSQWELWFSFPAGFLPLSECGLTVTVNHIRANTVGNMVEKWRCRRKCQILSEWAFRENWKIDPSIAFLY